MKKKPGRPKKSEASVNLSRWTILIPHETRVAVTKAAEREKAPLNEWINKALYQSARASLTDKREIAKPEDVSDVLQKLVERQDRTEKMIEELNKPWWKRKKQS